MTFAGFVDFAIALSLTIVIECSVAFAFGLRTINALLAVAAINLITNPILNFFITVAKSLNLFQINVFSLLPLELLVIFVEWRMLIYSVNGTTKKMFIVSFVMNMCSFISGLIILSLF